MADEGRLAYNSLCCAGAGVLGIAYIGALKAYEQRFGKGAVNKDFKRSIGTSAGALLSTCLALGLDVDQVENVFMEVDFTRFADQGYASMDLDAGEVLHLIANVRGKYGLNSGNYMQTWVDQLVASRIGGKRYGTFADVKKQCGDFGLHVTATDLTKARTNIYSADSAPDMPIADAVRASASIPIFFDIFPIGNDAMIDGGLLYNIPMLYFLRDKSKGIGVDNVLSLAALPIPSKNYEKLSMKPEPSQPINKSSAPATGNDRQGLFGAQDSPLVNFGWQRYLMGLIGTSIVSQIYHATEAAEVFNLHYLHLDTPPAIDSINFNITLAQKKQLVEVGYTQGMKFFEAKLNAQASR